MNIQLVISLIFCILINIGLENRVQANNNEILPLNSFFESWEKRHIAELRDAQSHRKDPGESIEHEKSELSTIRTRRLKKNKKVSKNKKATSSHKKPVKLAEKKRKRKKRRKVKKSKRFFKTTLNDVDRDSKMSNSKESDNMKVKPVDIIVHIKMHD